MASVQEKRKKKAESAQDFVPIREIHDGVAVLKNGGLRVILMASSVNFALKSEDEQTALLLQYQNFLNSLEFPVQIFIESRKLDISPYLTLLEEAKKSQSNELLGIQIREYIDFVHAFTESANIMSKTFFVVIPYEVPILTQGGGIIDKLLGRKKGTEEEGEINDKKFEEHRTQLEQRAGVVAQGLARVGIRVVQLGTEELVEMFFKIFNPGEVETPKL